MSLYKIYTVMAFLLLCFVIYIALSDESAVHNLPHLANWSILFVSTFFFKPAVELLNQKDKELSFFVRTFLCSVVAALWGIFLIYVKRSDLLDYNEAYSVGRFVYVFGTVAVSCLIAFVPMKILFGSNVKKAV
ncbi:hypothetical protein MmiEs2_12380 [Methanimicrococcus stummii]|uniref:Uncharacterized protein n=1 Tax=Methanimicrococcus stummii TaxID=3028294 RepID=A0AA96V9F8_9EURY|nr:hypothetical protein [Methanimicrococcus sp. Es2]WNY29024.1 hypothetical protein MmiEs2_12380 [Methanimicrococcus sp. Es2]